MPGPEQLRSIRLHLANHHREFTKLAANPKLKAMLGEIGGATLQRVPKGFDPQHPASDLLRKKQWFYYVTLDPALATTAELQSAIVDRFRVMLPIIEFLNTSLKAKKIRPEDILF